MPDHDVMADELIDVGSVADLEAAGVLVAKGADRPLAVFRDGDAVRAVDNRCPHLGFPLHQGTIRDGVLTCHWHHARFDLCSGCAFDLFADDVPVYAVKLDGDRILVGRTPISGGGRDYLFGRLRKGLEQNIGLIQAKSIIGLLQEGAAVRDILIEAARFGGRNHEQWADGMTSLALVGNLWFWLSNDTRILALAYATRRLAGNCSGRPARRERRALDGADVEPERLRRWLDQWLTVRHRDATERTVLTAALNHPDTLVLNDMLFGAVSDRIFANGGHMLDFLNKAFELLGHVGWEMASELLPTLIPQWAGARGGEEEGAWRDPVDLVSLIREVEERLPGILEALKTGSARDPEPGLRSVLLSDQPDAIVFGLARAIESGVSAVRVMREICLAAATRLVRFPESNDLGDWFDPVHTFIYSHAVHQSLDRSVSVDTVRGIFHGALAVYKDRFLNLPPAPLPGEKGDFQALPSDEETLLKAMRAATDVKQGLHHLPDLTVRYLRCGHNMTALVDTLAALTLREDLDFHKLQVLEAVVRQSEAWGREATAEREILFAAAARHLAAHCPTPRAESKMTRTAMRLHRGDPIHQ
jgi:nitrite reductase/ring-hydroxylating ferredoxin subunit